MTTLLLLLVTASPGQVEIPPGYEMIEITMGPGYIQPVRMNDCGEVVYAKRMHLYIYDNSSEIRYYDNGYHTGITADDIPDTYPDINEGGLIAWARGPDGSSEIVIGSGAGFETIGVGAAPRINALGEVCWKHRDAVDGCRVDHNLYLYSDGQVVQLTSFPDSEQGCALNDCGAAAWTYYDFCAQPYETRIMMYRDGVITALPVLAPQCQIPEPNDMGQAVWNSNLGVEMWDGAHTTVLVSDGIIPHLNNRGDVAFINDEMQTYVYMETGAEQRHFYKLTDTDLETVTQDINNHGEVVLRAEFIPAGIAGIWMLRRVRTGEADFDGDIDARDYAVLAACLTGPVETRRLCDCRFLDIDHDQDVDLADAARFQNAYTGR